MGVHDKKRPIYNAGLNEMGLSAFDTKICSAFAETLLFACRIANCNCKSFYLKKGKAQKYAGMSMRVKRCIPDKD